MRRVTVALTPPYDVVVGDGALAEVASVVDDRRKVAVVSQPGVADFHAPVLTAALHATGAATDVFLIGDGEDAKNLGTVETLCSQLATWGLLRGDAIVALGGGVVGDTAGLRGRGVPPWCRGRAGTDDPSRDGRRRDRRQDRGEPARG